MRILFVAMANSVHTGRWIDQLRGQGFEIEVFPVFNAEPPHPLLSETTCHYVFPWGKDVTANGTQIKNTIPYPRWNHRASIVERLQRRFPSRLSPTQRLARVIRDFKPDVIHSLELQHAGYLTLDARRLLGPPFPTWIATNWGSDIYLFHRCKAHLPIIKEILEHCDFYSSECHRDVALARRLGLKGEVLPVFPNAGGFDLAKLESLRAPGRTSQRKSIVLKGYQHWAGRALVGVRAIEMCADVLRDYEINIFSAYPDVSLAAELVAESTGLNIKILPPQSHDDMLRLYGNARVYMGLSISDGISTSFLEALVMGAFPIQSCTACGDEWIETDRGGFLVPPEDPQVIAAALRRAMTDDGLVDMAARLNAETARRRLDSRWIRPRAVDFYRRVMEVKAGVPGGTDVSISQAA